MVSHERSEEREPTLISKSQAHSELTEASFARARRCPPPRARWVRTEVHSGKYVHKGFINQLNGLIRDTTINAEIRGCGSNAVFVGHSLGGGISYAARAKYGFGAGES